VDSAYAWREFYAAERARLGPPALDALLDDAALRPLPDADAIVAPHTRLEVTGNQIAAAAQAIVDGGHDRVLALGVLHGGRRQDAALVAAARAGDADALAVARGVHTADGMAAEEFSLDAFRVLVERAAARAGRTLEVVSRYPFLAGDDPTTLPGFDELVGLVESGVALMATCDPVHHGRGYDTPAADCLAADRDDTVAIARGAIAAQLELLAEHRYAEFQGMAARQRSDFRDTGPVLAGLLGAGFAATIHDVALVDYAGVLGAPPPTWVAGALVTIRRPGR
jgi:hypothetical protein